MAVRSKQQTPLCLTDLPDEVVLKILFLLDIRDAARTSALSRAWRHLPVLVFGEWSIGGAGIASAAQSVLLRHLGQVQGFALDARSPPLPEADHPRLDDLLGHLSHPRYSFKALSLKVPSYKLHSSIFSCVELAHLELKGCLLPNPSPGFPGLPKLEELRIRYTVLLGPHLNLGQLDALGALISGCPSLEELRLVVDPHVLGVMLKISAPRLRGLVIEAWSTDFLVEFQSPFPDLTGAKLRLPLFRYAQEGGSKLMHVLQRISHVEKLELLNCSPWDDFQDMVPLKTPVTFENLKYLRTDADLGHAAHIALILYLIRCCPNIRDLEIKHPGPRHGFQPYFEETQEFWSMHGYGDLLRHLQVMKLINVYLSYNELHFMKLVLSKAQVLENCTIIHLAEYQSSSLEACIEIMKFKRLSQVAQIDYKVASGY